MTTNTWDLRISANLKGSPSLVLSFLFLLLFFFLLFF
uniref:Uncharacterized protein n=1 Tax=Rhizophora mucronata TaxID=61149 RepID=A0A2P2KTG3_RHIMU